jgi:taurine transport system permease protein
VSVKGIAAPRPRQLRAIEAGTRRALLATIPFLALIALWQAVAASGEISRSIFPAPSDLVGAFAALARGHDLFRMVLVTLLRAVAGGLSGLIVGLVFGAIVALSRRLASALDDLIGFFSSIGEIGWLPVLLLWTGFNSTTIVITIGYTVLFPVFFGTVSGFRAIPANLVNSVRTLGGTRYHIVREVMIPGALPAIITGFRTGMGFGWRTVILAELLVGGSGLGVLLFQSRQAFRPDWIMVLMVIIGLIWLGLDSLVLKPIERKTIERWGLLR